MLKIPDKLRIAVDNVNKKLLDATRTNSDKEPFLMQWNDISPVSKEKFVETIKDHSKEWFIKDRSMIDLLAALDVINPCLTTLEKHAGGWSHCGAINGGRLIVISRALRLYLTKDNLNKNQLVKLVESMICIPWITEAAKIQTEPIETIDTRLLSYIDGRYGLRDTFGGGDLTAAVNFYKIMNTPNIEIPEIMKEERQRRVRREPEQEIDIYGVRSDSRSNASRFALQYMTHPDLQRVYGNEYNVSVDTINRLNTYRSAS